MFPSLPHAHAVLDTWRRNYHEERPHSKLGWMMPGTTPAPSLKPPAEPPRNLKARRFGLLRLPSTMAQITKGVSLPLDEKRGHVTWVAIEPRPFAGLDAPNDTQNSDAWKKPNARKACIMLDQARSTGPSFMCVGLQKAGTQWLYDQLQHHPDFWMPPYKELHYFDREFPGRRIKAAAEEFLNVPERAAEWRARENYRQLDLRDATFFRTVIEFNGPQQDSDFYASLFAPAGSLITGDITPGYSSLKNKPVKTLAARFPEAKVLIMLREPVSRLWSQWNMRNLNRKESVEEGLDAVKLRWWAAKDDVSDRSYPSKIIQRWRRHFGDRVHTFFLDDVISQPDQTREAILSVLGARQVDPSLLASGYNRKEKERTLKRTPEIQEIMRQLFEVERKACAELLGGAALNWPSAPY